MRTRWQPVLARTSSSPLPSSLVAEQPFCVFGLALGARLFQLLLKVFDLRLPNVRLRLHLIGETLLKRHIYTPFLTGARFPQKTSDF
jgi:hypothetical protein